MRIPTIVGHSVFTTPRIFAFETAVALTNHVKAVLEVNYPTWMSELKLFKWQSALQTLEATLYQVLRVPQEKAGCIEL